MTGDVDTGGDEAGSTDPEQLPSRLEIASDLLADVIPRHTRVSLFGFDLERRPVGNVWHVIDDNAGFVDALNLEGTATATNLLAHLEGLRDALDKSGSGVAA